MLVFTHSFTFAQVPPPVDGVGEEEDSLLDRGPAPFLFDFKAVKNLFIYLFIYLAIYLFIHLFIYLFSDLLGDPNFSSRG